MSLEQSVDRRGVKLWEAPVVSIVMPCLNEEAETIGVCINKARRALNESLLCGEIVVADNGSKDGSPKIATESLGARVVVVAERGYGNALRRGIAEARGEFMVLGDAGRPVHLSWR